MNIVLLGKKFDPQVLQKFFLSFGVPPPFFGGKKNIYPTQRIYIFIFHIDRPFIVEFNRPS